MKYVSLKYAMHSDFCILSFYNSYLKIVATYQIDFKPHKLVTDHSLKKMDL